MLDVFSRGAVASALCVLLVSGSRAVDLESFEFNDAGGTSLAAATNTANPGNNWTSTLALSEVTGGSLRVLEESGDFLQNHLQMDDVSTGQVFLEARLAGWDLTDDAGQQVRFTFLNEDTGVSGNTVTAEMRFSRTSAGVELVGRALAGSGEPTPIQIDPGLTLATTRSAPFTAVLGVDFDAGTYKIFYKDGSAPSQYLGQGTLSPTRAARSVRFAVNGVFANPFAPLLYDEYADVDRIAVADANPLTDLLSVEIDRDTGAMTLTNSSGAALPGLESYTISSPVGGLAAAAWKNVADNYDQSGDGSVDPDGQWSVTSTTAFALSEQALDANGGALGNGQSVALNEAGQAVWLQSPFEDITVTLNFAGGVSRSADVTFVGNSGARFGFADLNFDGQLSADDWTVFIANAETDLSGLTPIGQYQRGDLDFDGVNSIEDFGLFKEAYDAANGAGAFAAMIAGVPEPAAALLAAVVATLGLARRRGFAVLALAALALGAGGADAGVLEDFTFEDPNGSLLAEVANSANPGNLWAEDGGDMAGSSVLDGSYRIQKNNDNFGTNYFDIDNVSSGKLWLVAEVAGWSYSSIVGPGEFDSGELEEVRFAFLDNDTGNSGSTITTQMEIVRTASGGISMRGAGGGTSSNQTIPIDLPLTQSNPYTFVLEYDGDAEVYTIFGREDGGAFSQLLQSSIDNPGRAANSVRMTVNNNFSGTGEFFDLDRLYVTDESPITELADPLTLRVNTTTGQVWIVNASTQAYDFDSYRITSSTDSLRPGDSFWSSLSDNNVDAIGPGIGESWDEAGGSDAGVLAESFLLGGSTLGVGEMLSLGSPVTPGSPDVAFQFRSNGEVFDGLIEFVSGGLIGDYNLDGSVDAADYTVWRDTLGDTVPAGTGADGDGDGTIDQDDYIAWRDNYGLGAGASAGADAAPEPAAAVLALLGGAGLARRRWRRFR